MKINQPIETLQKIKRIKENITAKEYKKLMSYVRGNESYREYKRLNLLRTFCILYYTGMRLNEVRDIKYNNIYKLLENTEVIVTTTKTSSERKLYLSDDFKKELLKLFAIKEDGNKSIIHNDRKKVSTNSNISFINSINKIIKEVLGTNFTSHSFRQGIITEMGSKGINTKIISSFIGHSDVKTTMRYIRPTDEDVKKAMVR